MTTFRGVLSRRSRRRATNQSAFPMGTPISLVSALYCRLGGGHGDRAQTASRPRRACGAATRVAYKPGASGSALATRDLLPSASRGAPESPRVVRTLSQGRLYDRDRVLARARGRPYRIRDAAPADGGLSVGARV